MKRKKKSSLVDQVVDHSKKPVKKKKPLSNKTEDLIPTGSTLLNLALSENPFGGLPIGKISNFIGDSWAGKTFLFLTMLAECSVKKRFSNYRLVHDNIEKSEGVDIENMFGPKLFKRIEDPASDTIQDFVRNIFGMIDEGRPFIYGMDSFDALTSDEELDRLQDLLKGKTTGSFKTEKTRGLSELLRMIKKGLKETNSHLCIISQVRENMDRMMFGPKLRRTGGKALKHWSSHEVWLAHIKSIKKTSKKLKRQIGMESQAKVTKNRITGKVRDISFPIIQDYGVDDIRSCIKFMVECGAWSKSGKINAKDFDLKLEEDKLIAAIEADNLEKDLKKIVGRMWMEIEHGLLVPRKEKY